MKAKRIYATSRRRGYFCEYAKGRKHGTWVYTIHEPHGGELCTRRRRRER